MTQDAGSGNPPQQNLLGREFSTAIVMFQDAVGRLMGLSGVERKCIDVLKRLGPVTAGTIGEHTGLTTGAVTGLMDRLEKAGYVRRERDPRDRRKVVLHLLPSEHLDAVLAAAFGPFGDDMTKIAAGYSPQELSLIGGWVAATTEALVANTRRLERLDPASLNPTG